MRPGKPRGQGWWPGIRAQSAAGKGPRAETVFGPEAALAGAGLVAVLVVGAIAFDRPDAVLDGNIERVLARLFDIHTPLPAAKPELRALAARLTPEERPGDYAQALMDLGSTICTPRSPACGICPLMQGCAARLAGTAAELPKKAAKKAKPVRRGVVYVVRRADGALLLETRPESGLLGGMLGWPGSDWSEAPDEAPPLDTDWQDLPGEVRHTFTHFHLILAIRHAEVAEDAEPARGRFVGKHDFRPSDLPTVMRKVYSLWRDAPEARTIMQ